MRKLVNPREIWQREDEDFSPWLSKNLDLLDMILDTELDLIGLERRVGPFFADLLCLNRVDNSHVVIENQLERSDHKHLGQLLTYASGLQATTIIWIATAFEREHRNALEWLNDNMNNRCQCFGVALELNPIGNSRCEPKFTLIAGPRVRTQQWVNDHPSTSHNQAQQRTNDRPPPTDRNDPESPSPRSPIRLTFTVTMPDGERIERDTIRATFVAVIEKLGEQFGMDRLVDLGIERYSMPIIATSKYRRFQQSQSGSHYILANQTTEDKKRDLKFWQIQSGSHYILVNQMTRDKERDLKKIAKGLNIELEIECRPKGNDWVRGVSQDTQRAANQELSETEQLMRKFWAGLQEYMNDNGSSVNCPAPTTRNYLQFSIGRTTFTLQAWVASTNREIGIRLYMAGDFSKAHYHLLKEQQEEIHNEFGETLEWHELPENERSRISLSKADTDSLDESDWPQLYKWFTATLERFNDVFRSRIQALNAVDWIPEDDDQ